MQECNAYDFSPLARWRSLLAGHQRYVLTTPEKRLSPMSGARQWSTHRNKLNMLHCIYLGVGRDVCGSLLLYLGRTVYGDVTLDAALKRLWREFKIWCASERKHTSMGPWATTTICWEKQT